MWETEQPAKQQPNLSIQNIERRCERIYDDARAQKTGNNERKKIMSMYLMLLRWNWKKKYENVQKNGKCEMRFIFLWNSSELT